MADSYGFMLEQYLDGLLAPSAHVEFEQAVSTNSSLRAQVEQQSAIDRELRRLFAVPAWESVFQRSVAAKENGRVARGEALAPPKSKLGLFRRGVAVAAAAAILLVAIWRVWTVVAPPPVDGRYAPQAWRSLETVYRDKLAAGFSVDWTCKDDDEFQATFRKVLGQPLLLAPLPPDVQSLGLGYCNSITPNTVFHLARVDGREVAVFVDRLTADQAPPALSDPTLHLFRRAIDELVLYEMTPLGEPRMLGLFYTPGGP